jgi:hypothetical protein
VNTSATQSDFDLPKPPAFCRIAVGILGLIVTLSALPWMYYSLSHFGGFDWGLFGFEFLTALAGFFAILLALGKFKEGWGIGVTAIAGSIMVALVFGIYVDFIMAKKTDFPGLYPLAKNTLLARAAIITAFFALASLAVFARNPKSFVYLFKAAIFTTPIAAVVLLMHYDIGPGVWINATLSNSASGSGALQSTVALTLGLFFIILISAAGHLLIRAYECGRPSPAKPQ